MPTRKARVDERGMMRQSSGRGRRGQGEGHTEEGLAFNSGRNISFSDPGKQMKIMVEDRDCYLFIHIYFFW